MINNNSFLKIINLESVDSTNNYAFRLAERGEKEITVVKAKSQFKGKGRREKIWFSPEDKGIYASFILRPLNPLKEVALLPIIFSTGIAKVLSKIIKVGVKWPNDVVVNGEKIAGVLVEARGGYENVDFVVAGLGINVNAEKEEIPSSATSIYIETGQICSVEELFRDLMNEIINLYGIFRKGNINVFFDEIFCFCKKEIFLEKLGKKVYFEEQVIFEREELNLLDKDIEQIIMLR